MKGKYPAYFAEPISDIRDMFLKSSERFAGRIALQHKRGGRWIPITYRELRAAVQEIMRREVSRPCRNLAYFKQATRLAVRLEEFEKTTTRKIKRYPYTGKASAVDPAEL